ncbi:uncharacterized protein TNCV_118491 [Trichonephila clavipes]|nr:uncharacterized protein TNCV_118491 [Trichonephila clavipes]
MVPDTIMPAVGTVCRCKTKVGLRRAAVQFPRARNYSKRRRRWVGFKVSTSYGLRVPKCPSARGLRMVREDTGTPKDGSHCGWRAADEAVGCTRAFLTTWR